MEAIAACLGAAQCFLGLDEGEISDDPTHTHRIMDMIRAYKPDKEGSPR